jgi:hypothetical protein
MAWNGLLGLGGASNPYLGLLGDTLTGVGIGLLNSKRGEVGAGIGQGLQYAQSLQQQRKMNSRADEMQKIAQQQLAIQQQTAQQQKAAFDQQQQQMMAQKQAAQSLFGGQSIPSNPMAFPAGAPPAGSSVGVTQPNPAIAQGLDHAQLAIMQQYAQADPGGALGLAAQQAFPKPVDPSSDMKNYQFYAQQETQLGRQPLPFNDWALQQKRASANMTTLNMPPQENAFQQKYGSAGGEAAGKLMYETIPAAQSRLNQLDALKSGVNALEAAGQDTGKLAPLKTKATALMQALNLDPTTLGLPADAGPAQAISAITNKLALDARSTADGAGMPGAMSDSDREFLSQTVPNISDTPTGLKMKVEIAGRVAKRQTEAAAQWNKYPQTQAGWAQFQQDWIAYNQQHPIFGPDDMKKIAGIQTAPVTAPPPSAAPAIPALPSGGGWH